MIKEKPDPVNADSINEKIKRRKKKANTLNSCALHERLDPILGIATGFYSKLV